MRDYRIARERMVREQLHDRGVRDRKVLAAMKTVPRHRFVPPVLQPQAYMPCALPIGYDQTISQPFIVGLMTALLELKGTEKVLEVGTGSGYQAAVLAQLASCVVTVERVEPLAERAASVLDCDEYANVSVHAADGTVGWPDDAPYDAILVTACAGAPPRALLDQVADGGLLLVPVSEGEGQVIFRYRRHGDEFTVERSVSCSFVPLRRGIEGAQHA